jgi:hypothetical protein
LGFFFLIFTFIRTVDQRIPSPIPQGVTSWKRGSNKSEKFQFGI